MIRVMFAGVAMVVVIAAISMSGCKPPVAKFWKGERVQLNSGGPVMTVDTIYTNGDSPDYTTEWFDATGRVHSENFDEPNLHAVR